MPVPLWTVVTSVSLLVSDARGTTVPGLLQLKEELHLLLLSGGTGLSVSFPGTKLGFVQAGLASVARRISAGDTAHCSGERPSAAQALLPKLVFPQEMCSPSNVSLP